MLQLSKPEAETISCLLSEAVRNASISQGHHCSHLKKYAVRKGFALLPSNSTKFIKFFLPQD